MFARRSLLLAGAVLLSAATAPIATGVSSAATPAATASIRSAHLSPETPGVDIYLTAFSGGQTSLWVADETYGGVSAYKPVAAGLYTVAMRPHGAPASQAPMLSWTINAQPGKAYTAAALGSGAQRTGTVLDDNLTPPAAGKARVRLIQAASVAPKATVVAVSGPVLAQNAAYATATGYAQIAAGTWPLKAESSSTPTLTATGSVSVPAGSVTSILLLDKPGGGLELHSVLDAASAVQAPTGPVPAGGGGTATSFTSSGVSNTALAEIGLSATLVLGLLGYLANRLRSSRRGLART